eukprot:5590052-Lingulodinium_polyedra.AAC.1
MQSRFTDTELTRRLYIGCASIRNTMGRINEHLVKWVASRIDFKSAEDLPPQDVTKELFTCLGVEPSVVESLAETLGLHWNGQRLCVHKGCKKLANLHGE